MKEAPEVPTEHPQWDMLDDEEEEPEGDGSDVSEFTTDEDVEEEQDWRQHFVKNEWVMETRFSFMHYGSHLHYL